MRLRQGRNYIDKGFTLVELLVVIAITAILLGLLLGPLIQGFNLTRQGQVQTEAQSVARLAMEQISNELKRAAYVFDNSNRVVNVWVRDANGNLQAVPLRNAVIDLVPPAYGDPSQASNDPTSDVPLANPGQPEPTLSLPLTSSRRVVRYFIGLQDNRSNNGRPLTPYNNGFEQRLAAADQADNLCVLYRAEFPLYVQNSSGRWVLNPDLFDTLADFYDPNFFYGDHWDGWRKVSRPVGPVGRIDMVNAQYDNNNVIMGLTPLMQFRPAQVTNQTGAPIETQTLSDEMGTSVPLQIRFPHGLWTMNTDVLRLVMFRSLPDALDRSEPLRYFYSHYDSGSWMLRYYRQDPGGGNTMDVPVCNLSAVRTTLLLNRPPTGNWLMTNNDIDGAEPMAFFMNDESGILDFSLPWWMSYSPQELEFATGAPYTPNNDPNPDPRTINGRYNYDFNLPQNRDNINNVRRFITLLDLDLNGEIDQPVDNHLVYPNASIVPGSEQVIGPDQRPGANYGQLIRYQRVPSATADVGPNQYRINYTDVVPIRDVMAGGFRPGFLRGYIEFYSDPLTPIPLGTVVVRFHYQFNLPGDSMIADYETRRLMNLSLGVKLYGGGDRSMNYNLNTQIELPNLIQLQGNP